MGQILLNLKVDGASKYQAIGHALTNLVSWRGTLRNVELETDELSMANLPKRISIAKERILQCAKNSYAGRNIQITESIKNLITDLRI